mgnify:CR=1 FL=1
MNLRIGLIGRKVGMTRVYDERGRITPVTVIDETVSDGVAEIVNIVAGSAKAKLNTDASRPLDLSLPTVVYSLGDGDFSIS